ncbi:hypothetical protein [Sinomonas susongensis]|uniref:hypothetical protein n=1 Tax=Sinomonas susongensis TaxID=1324851 RepID=UPI0011086A8B|nr:hypothetical protein [Sinomonas susongensis]
MTIISPAAAAVRLRRGESFALTSGTSRREGTVVAVHPAGFVWFDDEETKRLLLADLAHWDAVEIGAAPVVSRVSRR